MMEWIEKNVFGFIFDISRSVTIRLHLKSINKIDSVTN